MKKTLSIFLCLLMCLPLTAGCAYSNPENILAPSAEALAEPSDSYKLKSIKIAGNDLSEYVIVQSDVESECLNFAAEEFAAYIEKSCGVKLEIAASSDSSKVIELGVDDTLEDCETLSIRVTGSKLKITGGSERGCLYGVYEFLESYVGWLFLTSECEELVTETDAVEIPEGLKDVQTPGILNREFYTSYYGSDRVTMTDKRKISYAASENSGYLNRGAYIKYGGSAHTLEALAEVQAGTRAMCLSDENLIQTVVANALKAAAENTNPAATYLSVTQNDSMEVCSCANCSRINEEEEADSGTLVRLINRVAEALKKDYPELYVHTFAYLSTTVPPKVTRFTGNVAVEYTTMYCCYQHSLTDEACCEKGGWNYYYFNNQEKAQHIKDWAKLGAKIMIYQYMENFDAFIPMFPVGDTLRENFRFFAENDVMNYLYVACNSTNAVTMQRLNAYLCTELAWNPYMTEEEYDECIDKFMKAYYGDAWEEMRGYYDFMIDTANNVGYCFAISNYTGYRMFRKLDIVLNEEEIKALFACAKAAVGEDAVRLDRVAMTELQYNYVLLSSRYSADYIYGSETIKAEYQKKTKEMYDAVQAMGWSESLAGYTYDPDEPPLHLYKDYQIKGNELLIY